MLCKRDTLAIALLLSMLWVACGGSQNGNVEYEVSAKANYKKGAIALKENNWLAATKYFSFVKARFAYSKYAVMSELGLADSEFGAGNYLQAVDAYKLFIQFHPTHGMVSNGYAKFRIGESYYKMLPDDWWLLPPSFEKDQSATGDAHRELREFLHKYPKSRFAPQAKKLAAEINDRLAAHEWYVAQFYWQRDKPMATVLRLRRLLKKYTDTSFEPEAMLLLGRAYLRVQMPDRAKAILLQLINKHPKSSKAGEARGTLATIRS